MSAAQHRSDVSHSRRGRWYRRFQARQRLLSAIAVGVGTGLTAPGEIGVAMRAVIGWDAGVVVFLVLAAIMVARATPETTRWRARLEDEARWVFLVVMAAAAFFSMFAILGVLREAHGTARHVTVELALLAAATILLSWIFAHTQFAVHYAHDYYSDREHQREAGLSFPGKDDTPDYWDFLYFSFVIGMTCQVSDVQVTTARWRRLVLAHGLVSFLYNTLVLALSINLLASLL